MLYDELYILNNINILALAVEPQSLAKLVASNREAPSFPAPSVCDNMTTSLLCNKTKSAPKAYESPNILIDWNNLKKLIDYNLGPYKVCKRTNRTLVKKMSVC